MSRVEELASEINALTVSERLALWRLLQQEPPPSDAAYVREPVQPKPNTGGAAADKE